MPRPTSHQLDRRHLARDAKPLPLEVKEARGSILVDADGREYLDLVMGWCVGNLGWAQRDVTAAVRRFRGPDYVFPEFEYAPWADLATRLAKLAPRGLSHAFRATGGTEAVDVAMQAAMLYTGRSQFLSLEDSYHGDSIATYSIGASQSRATYPRLLPGCHKLKGELDERALRRAQTLLSKRKIAAFVMEPISMNLGAKAPSQEFTDGMRRLCERYGTLFIADEVACGFGRTGTLFASERYGLRPDIMCLAKALTNGAAPMGATLVTGGVYDEVHEDLSVWSTYGWHPLAVEAARATLGVWEKRGARILRNVEARGEQFRERLSAMPFDEAEVRQVGLAVAVELESDEADRLQERCREEGVLVNASGGHLQMFPALTIDRSTAQDALDAIERSV